MSAGTAPAVAVAVAVDADVGTPPPTLLLCAYRSLTVDTALSIFELARRGWRMLVRDGDALISRARSVLVSQWFAGTEEDVFLMIDDDVVFRTEGAERVVALARETRSIACGAYLVRGGKDLPFPLGPEIPPFTFEPGAAPVEVACAATGFMAVHRDVIAALTGTLPLCHTWTPRPFWPLFLPAVMVAGDPVAAEPRAAPHTSPEFLYAGEDWAFCARARAAGVSIWLAPDVALSHLKEARYAIPDGTRWDGTALTPLHLRMEERMSR